VKQKAYSMAEHNEIGKIGEELTKTFLMKQGFAILDQNYRIKQGEIDIIAEKDKIIHFIEVKTIKVRSCVDISGLFIQPEDNLTLSKWNKLIIAIQSFILSKGIPAESHYQIDLACVYLDTEKREGRVRLLQNIHKE
jgi:putative endonuclease